MVAQSLRFSNFYKMAGLEITILQLIVETNIKLIKIHDAYIF